MHCNLSTSIDPRDAEFLRSAYRRYGWVLFPGQDLSMNRQMEVCRVFGSIVDSPCENFYVSNVRSDGVLGTRELLFHSDVPFLPMPYDGVSLHAVDVTPQAAPTRFIDACDAYQRLPQALKSRIAGMKALQARERNEDRRTRLTDLHDGDMCTVHPLVRHEPGTGRPYLFANEDMTACIVGLPEAESDALLDELFGYLYAEGRVLEHRWTTGDLVIWNNLTVQHARNATGSGTRTLQRVTIAELGYTAQYPADTMSVDLHNDTLLAGQASDKS